mgnify:CR=1 FL=1
MPTYMVLLSVVPLLGSFITEPAAMTLAALMLRDTVFSRGVSLKLQYTTLAVLFVNVSIGGTVTHFAAPPVLMVARSWHWDTAFMLTHFGWRAVFYALASYASVCLVAVLVLLRESLPAERRRQDGLGQILAVYRRLLAHR